MRRFLDCGYTLLVETFLGMPGMDLLTALDRVDEAIGLTTAIPVEPGVPTAADNDRALKELKLMMGGIGG